MRVQVDDVRLYFDVSGMGLVPDGPVMRERPVIVCLHGGPGFDHSSLKPFFAPLAQDAQVIFLDHRGQGRSDPSTPERWTLDTWIEDLRLFCEALGLDRPIIVGQSFGGVVALGAAIRYPELQSRLIVSSSIARFRLDRALAMFERRGGEEVRAVAERFFEDPNLEHYEEFKQTCLPVYNTTPADPNLLARTLLRPEVGIHFFRGEAFTYDWLDDLQRIRCPTLVLGGAEDPITTLADQQDIAAAIPGAQLEIFPDAGHGVFRDKPAEALEVVRRFAFATD